MPEDYDEWAQAGNAGWDWASVLPAFKRLERDLDFGGEDYHGDSGPITIRRYPHNEMEPQHQAFLDTASALGYPECLCANTGAHQDCRRHQGSSTENNQARRNLGYRIAMGGVAGLYFCPDTTSAFEQ